jgi:hypothetical protein
MKNFWYSTDYLTTAELTNVLPGGVVILKVTISQPAVPYGSDYLTTAELTIVLPGGVVILKLNLQKQFFMRWLPDNCRADNCPAR